MKILLLCVALAQSCFSIAMEHGPKKLITLEGYTATLLDHIERSRKLMNISAHSTTLLLRYEHGQIKEKGDLSLIPTQEMEDIKNDNYVFFAGYAFVKTRISNNQKQLVNAVIVGTTNQSILSLSSRLTPILAEKRKKMKKKLSHHN